MESIGAGPGFALFIKNGFDAGPGFVINRNSYVWNRSAQVQVLRSTMYMKPGPAPEIGEKKPGPALNHSGNRVDGSFAAPLLGMTAESRDRHTD